MNIALFDFDGTITFKDSFIDFIKFSFGNIRFFKGIISVSHCLILYKMNCIPNWKAKEKIFKHFFGNCDYSFFYELGREYSMNRLQQIIRSIAQQTIEKHKKNGDVIVVVSASAGEWIKPWCDKHGIDLISTHYEIVNGIMSGKIDGKNCYGPEKTARILAKYDLSKFNVIYAYGDSKGDFEMLKLAHQKYYKWRRLII